jgi:hypothetical protein
MKCNIYSGLGIISIILIISIIILVYYKNMKDDNIEAFYDKLDDMIVSNNKLLNTNLNNLISSQINTVSDPNTIDKELQYNIAQKLNSNASDIVKQYSTTNQINNKLITELEKNVTDLENMINNKIRNNLTSTKYSIIKSLNNGMEVDLFNTPNTVYKDERSGINTKSFLVGLNNGCLSVGLDDYDIYQCDDLNIKQQFKLQHVINDVEYKQNVDKAVNFDNVDTTKINYPFVMVKSLNNDNCLTNNNGNITVQPCYAYEAQRWMPL